MMLRALSVASLATSAAGHGLADAGRSVGWTRPAPQAGVRGTDEDYEVEGEKYQGYVALPARPDPLGGVLVAHQWMGLGEYEKARADELAAIGFTAFALDTYGKGIRCEDEACATQAMAESEKNITKLRGLISAGTQQLLQHFSDPDRLLALGYCYGGAVVLELARHPGMGASDGVVYKAVSGIHAVLDPFGEKASQGEVVAKVQVHHAELDPSGDAGLAAFEAEMRVGVNGSDGEWNTMKYSKCEHGWSEPGTPIYRARPALQAHKSTFEFFLMALGIDDPDADPFPPNPVCSPASSSLTALV